MVASTALLISGLAAAAASLIGSGINAGVQANENKINRERADTAYQRQKEDLISAGLNPAYGLSSGGSVVGQTVSPSIDIGQLGGFSDAFSDSAQLKLQKQQTENQQKLIDSQVGKNTAEAELAQSRQEGVAIDNAINLLNKDWYSSDSYKQLRQTNALFENNIKEISLNQLKRVNRLGEDLEAYNRYGINPFSKDSPYYKDLQNKNKLLDYQTQLKGKELQNFDWNQMLHNQESTSRSIGNMFGGLNQGAQSVKYFKYF